MSNDDKAFTKLFAIAALLQIVWGLVPTASNIVISEIPVELYISLRWTISGLIFATYLLVTNGWNKISVRSGIAVCGLGVLGYGVASFGTLYGLKIGGVTNFALVGALGPAVTSLVSIFILKEKPTRSFYFALPVSLLGLLVLAVGKYQISSVDIATQSAVFILGGCTFEALAFVFSKKFKSQMSATQYLAIAQLGAAGLMWSLQLSIFQQIGELKKLSADGILAAVFVSVVACVLCYAILYWLLNYLQGHKLALFEVFHTISATIFGWLIFNETLSPFMVLGGLLILVGLIVGNWPSNLKATQRQ